MAHYAIYLGQPRGERLLHPKYKSKRSQPSAIVYFPYGCFNIILSQNCIIYKT